MIFDIPTLKLKGYGRGSIIRCKMYNFLTYDEVEVFPGPKLNILLGPNGTGKSAITHAICLACCGKPSILGRSNELAQFVKRGKEEFSSYVEIDILDVNIEFRKDCIHTIRRVLHSHNNSSEWSMNSRRATEREVRRVVLGLNIDVENLCSFMPQDRVGQFAGYSPRLVLQKTLQSISDVAANNAILCNHLTLNKNNNNNNNNNNEEEKEDIRTTNLYETQMKLAEDQKMKNKLDSDCAEKEREVLKYQHEMNVLEPHVRAAEMRQLLIELKDYYEIKKSLVQLEEAKNIVKIKQKQVEDLEQNIELEEQKMNPLLQKERDYKRNLVEKEEQYSKILEIYNNKSIELKDYRSNTSNIGLNIETLTDEIKRLEMTTQTLLNQLQNKKEEKNRNELQLIQAKNVLTNQNVEMKIKDLDNKKELYRTEYDEIQNKLMIDEMEQNNIKTENEKLQKQLNQYQDPLKIWQNTILKKNDNSFIGKEIRPLLHFMNYLIQNKEQLKNDGIIKGEIYGPIAYYCKVKNPICGLMLEKSVTPIKWLQFVTTNDHDGNYIKEYAKKNNLKIDVAVEYSYLCNDLNNRLKRGREELYNQQNQQIITSLGIQGLLIDEIECPDPVKCFLLDYGGLSTSIYWSTNVINNNNNIKYNNTALIDNVTDSQFEILCPINRNFVKLFIHNELINSSSNNNNNNNNKNNKSMRIEERSISRSNYARNDIIVQGNQLNNKDLMILFAGNNNNNNDNNNDDRNILIKQINELQKSLEFIDNKINNYKLKKKDIDSATVKIKEEISTLNNLKKQPQQLEIKLQTINKNIKDIEDKLAKCYAGEERKIKIKELEKLFEKLLKSINLTNIKVKETALSYIDRCVYEKTRNKCKLLLTSIQENVNEAQETIKLLKDDLKLKRNDRDHAQLRYNKNNELIKTMQDKVGKDGFKIIVETVIEQCGPITLTEYQLLAIKNNNNNINDNIINNNNNNNKNKLGRIIPKSTTMDEIDIIMEELTTEIESKIDNPDIFRRYGEAKAKLELCTTELERSKNLVATRTNGLQERIDKWTVQVEALVTKLNALFTNYMKELLYKGEVEFKPTGNIDDYEIVMKVAYRENEVMVPLTSQRQSGGEKSVATIMYLMALQGLTTSPFRVVDEINQGMDERNERLVIDRIVKSCCGTDDKNKKISRTTTPLSKSQQIIQDSLISKPQYFLVSPKLLQALRAMDHPDVTILMVWNGPGIIDNKWQIDKIVDLLRDTCKKRKIALDDITFSDDEYNEKDDISDDDNDYNDIINNKKRNILNISKNTIIGNNTNGVNGINHNNNNLINDTIVNKVTDNNNNNNINNINNINNNKINTNITPVTAPITTKIPIVSNNELKKDSYFIQPSNTVNNNNDNNNNNLKLDTLTKKIKSEELLKKTTVPFENNKLLIKPDLLNSILSNNNNKTNNNILITPTLTKTNSLNINMKGKIDVFFKPSPNKSIPCMNSKENQPINSNSSKPSSQSSVPVYDLSQDNTDDDSIVDLSNGD